MESMSAYPSVWNTESATNFFIHMKLCIGVLYKELLSKHECQKIVGVTVLFYFTAQMASTHNFQNS
jgi:hypothetical protein